MAEPLLSVERVSCRFGGLLAVNAASLTVAAGRYGERSAVHSKKSAEPAGHAIDHEQGLSHG